MPLNLELDELTIGLASYNHALRNVIELPKYYRDSKLPSLVRSACLETWLVNMRLLSEFFGVSGPNSKKVKDFKASEYLDIEIDEETRKLLEEIWLISSKLVVHLSKDRDPKSNNFDTEKLLKNMGIYSVKVLEVSEKFEHALKAVGSEYAFLVEVSNASARTYLMTNQ